MIEHLILLYTFNIRGDLSILPRLYTFIQSLKTDSSPVPLLLDLGQSCAPDVWPCAITGGRSTLIVLDGMGYHAANVQDVLAGDQREKIEGIVAMALVDDGHGWHYHVPPTRDDTIVVLTHPQNALAPRLQIILTPAAETHLTGNALFLQGVGKGQVGLVEIALDEKLCLLEHTIHTMPPGTAPNPSIVAAVEFVESEARYYEDNKLPPNLN